MRVFNSANYSSLDSSVGRLQIESKSKWNRNELKCRYRRFESGSRELLFSCKVQSEREENPHRTFFCKERSSFSFVFFFVCGLTPLKSEKKEDKVWNFFFFSHGDSSLYRVDYYRAILAGRGQFFTKKIDEYRWKSTRSSREGASSASFEKNREIFSPNGRGE